MTYSGHAVPEATSRLHDSSTTRAARKVLYLVDRVSVGLLITHYLSCDGVRAVAAETDMSIGCHFVFIVLETAVVMFEIDHETTRVKVVCI